MVHHNESISYRRMVVQGVVEGMGEQQAPEPAAMASPFYGVCEAESRPPTA
jgi:hypothetical protein